ncbi:MAG: hypothetical protein U0528_04970 [Anaerolineae bacterium]
MEKTGIQWADRRRVKDRCLYDLPLNLGAIGVTGTEGANYSSAGG